MGIREIISPKRMIKNEIWKKRMKKEQIPYKKEQELEDAIITKSDYIIMNNPYQKQYMTGKYSDAIKAKAIVLQPNMIDRTAFCAHAAGDVCAFKRGACRGGAANAARAVCADELPVCADIQKQRRFNYLFKSGSAEAGDCIRADEATDDRRKKHPCRGMDNQAELCRWEYALLA